MADRTRSVYVPPVRVDVTVREGVRAPLPVALARLARAIRSAAVAGGAPGPCGVGLVLTDDGELAALNVRHMGKRGPTDVLSFPLLPPETFGRGLAHRASAPGPSSAPGLSSAPDATSVSDGNVSIGGPPYAESRAAAGAQFPAPPGSRVVLGDIAISVERAIVQAGEGRGGQDSQTRWDARDELLLLAIHGTLHLCGFDHAAPDEDRAMRALEREILTEA